MFTHHVIVTETSTGLDHDVYLQTEADAMRFVSGLNSGTVLTARHA